MYFWSPVDLRCPQWWCLEFSRFLVHHVWIKWTATGGQGKRFILWTNRFDWICVYVSARLCSPGQETNRSLWCLASSRFLFLFAFQICFVTVDDGRHSFRRIAFLHFPVERPATNGFDGCVIFYTNADKLGNGRHKLHRNNGMTTCIIDGFIFVKFYFLCERHAKVDSRPFIVSFEKRQLRSKMSFCRQAAGIGIYFCDK